MIPKRRRTVSSTRVFSALVICLVLTGAAWADLQNVSIHGDVRMRWRIYHNVLNDSGPALQQIRVPNALLQARPIGDPRGVVSMFSWDDGRSNDWKIAETALVFGFTADFTEDVTAVIDLYSYDRWGTDFRSDYITGADFAANSIDDIEIEQAYIETKNTFGVPLQLRAGRQEIVVGKGWLVSNMTTPTQRLAFDGIRATYAEEAWRVDGWWAKLAEFSPVEQDGDVDFYALGGAYTGLEFLDLELYWYWIRDARSINDTDFFWMAEWIEDVFNVDDYDVTNLHTLSLRANGKWENLDYDLELAYQWGDADTVGSRFRPFTYGDDGAEYDSWAGNLIVGYTFAEAPWAPRPYIDLGYFGGEDNRDITFWDWLNPFDSPQASVSFNRLFSPTNTCPVAFDNGCLTNVQFVRAGVKFKPTEKISADVFGGYFEVVEPFDMPKRFKIGRFFVPVAPALSFWTEELDNELGWTAGTLWKYDYNENLSFLLWYDHLWPGEGLTGGSYIFNYGLLNGGGTDDDQADYAFLMTHLRF